MRTSLYKALAIGGFTVVLLAIAYFARGAWVPPLQAALGWLAPATSTGDEHAHDQAEPAGDVLELSPQALANIGFEPYTVALRPFTRTISVPAIVAGRPGQTRLNVAAPLSGIVTGVYVTEGAAIAPGTPMFELRLTHEELVSGQAEFLETVESLDVLNREIARLESIAEGIIAGRQILEQKYEQQKLQARLRAQRQGLLLHGLSDEQVDAIVRTRDLLQSLTVAAPRPVSDCAALADDHPLVLQELLVEPGSQVNAGDPMAVMADYCTLLIEGSAFEDDAEHLNVAVQEQWTITAAPVSGTADNRLREGLEILYVADRIDPDSRALHFYVNLPNEIVRDETRQGKRYIQWRFKPGERMELRVPLAQYDQRLVVPLKAIVEEGAKTYVFQQNGDQFRRVEVHVEQRGADAAVIAADGSLFPGSVIAGSGAYRMQLELKNRGGGAIDPHAGHSH